jgi:hypothetical protein
VGGANQCKAQAVLLCHSAAACQSNVLLHLICRRAVRVYSASSQAGVQEALLGLLVAMVLRMPAISATAAEAGAVDVLTEVLAAAPAMAAAAKQAKQAQQGDGSAAGAADDGGAGAANGSSSGGGTADAATAGNQDAAVDELASRVFGVGVSSGSNGCGAAAAVQRQACMAVRNMVVRNPELRPAFLQRGAEQLLRGVRGVLPGGDTDVATAALRDLGVDQYNV